MSIAPEVRDRLPLAEAVLLVWRHLADEAFLEQIFQAHRGRSYTRLLSFPLLVELVGDVLLNHPHSARHELESAQETGALPASIQAAYAKLRRMPVDVSVALLNGGADRLLELYPAGVRPAVPSSLAGMEVFILDGKTVKWVHKRLKVLRQATGGAVGGKALVGLSMNRGLVVAIHAHPDGDANEVRFVGDLLPPLRQRLGGVRLFVTDCGFCDLKQADRFRQEGDHFLFRYHPHVLFQRDENIPQRRGTDAQGRSYVESWGFLGTKGDPRHLPVRQIVLQRPGETPLILLTDLTDAQTYPATDLLAAYRNRWGIERVFQQVTEVFGLARLIGTSPKATIFQLVFCLLIYNVIQVVRAGLAQAHQRPVQTISPEKLFVAIQQQLQVWTFLIRPEQTLRDLAGFSNLPQVRQRLTELLAECWSNVWLKAPPQRRKPPPAKACKQMHVSVFRLLEAERMEKPKKNLRHKK